MPAPIAKQQPGLDLFKEQAASVACQSLIAALMLLFAGNFFTTTAKKIMGIYLTALSKEFFKTDFRAMPTSAAASNVLVQGKPSR